MKSKKVIDFLLIGAQKSATTSLFKYLSMHPEIYMPPEKEANFFSYNSNFFQGKEWYINQYFRSADTSKKWGEASPNYMIYDYVPARIHGLFPEIKLIAILRNPIMRAYSHYRMAVRRNLEKRSFDECINILIERDRIFSKKIDEEREFILFGEYGRIFSNYLNFFPKENIQIVFMEDLLNDPSRIMKSLYDFLGVTNEFYSNIFGQQFNPGGYKRFSSLDKVLSLRLIKQPLRWLLPAQLRRTLGFWFITEVIVKKEAGNGPSEYIKKILRDFYKTDVALLEKMFKLHTPWEEFGVNNS